MIAISWKKPNPKMEELAISLVTWKKPLLKAYWNQRESRNRKRKMRVWGRNATQYGRAKT